MANKPRHETTTEDIPAEELESALIMTSAVVPPNAEDELRREAAVIQRARRVAKRRAASDTQPAKPASKVSP